MSPMQKMNVTPMMTAMIPFGTMDHMRTFGSTIEASCTSSAGETVVSTRSTLEEGVPLHTHVHCAVVAHKYRDYAHHTNERGEADIRPSRSCGELEKCIVHIATRCHDPKRDDDRKQASYVQDE